MDAYTALLLAVAFQVIVLGLMQLSHSLMNWECKRHLRILSDFIIAFDEGNCPDQMASVYDAAVYEMRIARMIGGT